MDLQLLGSSLSPWHWLTLGAVLCIIEIVISCNILLWPGLAALATGLLTLAAPMLSWQLQIVLFGILAIVATIVGRAYFKKLHGTDQPLLNRRAEQFIGRILTLTAPIEDGLGSAIIDQTRWRLIGPDSPSGQKVKVIGLQGSSLVVEAQPARTAIDPAPDSPADSTDNGSQVKQTG